MSELESRLRDALKATADRLEVKTPELPSPVRKGQAPMALLLTATLIALAGVIAVVIQSAPTQVPPSTDVVPSPSPALSLDPSVPAQYVAIRVESTIDSPSAIVVRDTRTGETLRELANSTPGERFSHLAVASDGTVYFSRQKPYSRGEEEGTEFEVLSVPKTGGEVRTFARGRSPAVSPDGQYLAMVGAPLEVLCPKEPLVVIDLSTGARRTWQWAGDESGDGNSECGGVQEISWSPDSQKVVFSRQLFEESVEIRLLDLSRPEGTILDAELIGGLKRGWRAATFRTNNTLLLAERSDPEHYSRLVELDLGTGVPSTVREFEGSNIVSLAVDSSNENIVVTLHRDEPRKFEGVLITSDGLAPLGDGLIGFHWLDQP